MIDSSDQLETLNPYVSRETIKKLSDYRDSIISAKFNLVSKKDKDHIWIRHFHDSLRLGKFFEKNSKKIKIPDELDYSHIVSLSNEIREKLTKLRPKTISQASRIDGITPSSINLILTFIKNRAKSKKSA